MHPFGSTLPVYTIVRLGAWASTSGSNLQSVEGITTFRNLLIASTYSATPRFDTPASRVRRRGIEPRWGYVQLALIPLLVPLTPHYPLLIH